MSTRHPAGRGCWGGATAILAIAGVLTASLLGILHMATSGDSTVPANAPAAVVQTLAPTTTPAVTTTPAATTTAPAAAPRALVATEESPVVTNTPSPTEAAPPATDVNGVRIAPPNPNANINPTDTPPGPGDVGYQPPGGGKQAQPTTAVEPGR